MDLLSKLTQQQFAKLNAEKEQQAKAATATRETEKSPTEQQGVTS